MTGAGRVATGVAALLMAAPAASAAPTWRELPAAGAAPPARSDHALAATSARHVYLHGGRSDGRARADLWRLDLESGGWERLEPRGRAPTRRFGQNLVAERGGTLLLFGGQAGARFFADAWRYDPRRNSWTRIDAAGPAARYGAAAALDPRTGRLYVSHGFTNAGRFDDTWALRGGRFATASAPRGRRPLRRCLVQGAFFGGAFYLFGGQSNPRPFLGDLWRLDVRRRRWRRLRPARRPAPRNLYAAARAGRHWYVHGGAGRRGELGDLWRLDLRRARFTPLAPAGPAPSARSSHSAAAAGRDRIVIFGGTSAAGEELNDTWVLDPR